MAGRRDLNRTFSPATNSFQRLSFTVVWEKSFLESECLRIWNFYPFHYADKVIGTIPFENLYLYLENVIVLLFYRAKLQYYGILSLNSFCTLSQQFPFAPIILSSIPYHSLQKKIIRMIRSSFRPILFLRFRSYHFIIQLLSFLQNCIIQNFIIKSTIFLFIYIYILPYFLPFLTINLKKKITYLRRIFRLRIRIPYSNSVKIRSSVRFIPPSLSLSL